MLAPPQTPTHEVVRSDGVVVARGDEDRLTSLAAWLTATRLAGEEAVTFEVRPRSKRRQQA